MASTAMLNAVDANNIPRIGHLFWYEVGGIDQSWQDAEAIFAKNKIDPTLLPKPTRKKAYHSALKSIRKMGAGLQVRILARPVDATTKRIRHQITIESVSGDTLEYYCEMFTQLDRETGDVQFETGAHGDYNERDEAMQQLIEEEVRRHMDHITPQALRNFIAYEGHRLTAVCCRPRGGLWFVSEQHTKRMRSVQKLVEDFGDSWLHLHPVLDTTDWRSNIADYVERDFDVEIGKFTADVDTILDEAKGNAGVVKQRVLETKIANFNQIQTKAAMYESLLNYRATHLREEVKKQCDRIEQIIRGEVPEFTSQLPYKERKQLERAEVRAAKAQAAGLELEDEFKEVPF